MRTTSQALFLALGWMIGAPFAVDVSAYAQGQIVFAEAARAQLDSLFQGDSAYACAVGTADSLLANVLEVTVLDDRCQRDDPVVGVLLFGNTAQWQHVTADEAGHMLGHLPRSVMFVALVYTARPLRMSWVWR
ncbi:MAG: hypothetical protein ACRD0K_10120 [Egibacteraceae bacterium]